jgi:hypothetical protein
MAYGSYDAWFVDDNWANIVNRSFMRVIGTFMAVLLLGGSLILIGVGISNKNE